MWRGRRAWNVLCMGLRQEYFLLPEPPPPTLPDVCAVHRKQMCAKHLLETGKDTTCHVHAFAVRSRWAPHSVTVPLQEWGKLVAGNQSENAYLVLGSDDWPQRESDFDATVADSAVGFPRPLERVRNHASDTRSGRGFRRTHGAPAADTLARNEATQTAAFTLNFSDSSCTRRASIAIQPLS